MLRKVRFQYPGTSYQVTSRRDQRAHTFLDDIDQHDMHRCVEQPVAGNPQKSNWKSDQRSTKHAFLRSDTIEGEQISGTNYLFTRDHLGSVREVTDAGGAVVARYAFDPYGRRTSIAGSSEVDLGFTGHYYHAPSGLHLAPYRAYDADMGRWLSSDPLGEAGGLNLYAYVGNDPINYVDPYGLAFGDWWDWRTYSPGYAQLRGQADIQNQLKRIGYDSMADFQLDNPGYGGTMTSGNLDAIKATATAAGEAANMYLTAATSVTPTGAGVKCVQAAVRTGARNLGEQLALREAEAGAGQRIMQGLIKDPAFPENLWAKMQHVHGDTVIHYWQNLQTGERVGFKFKD